MNHLKTASSQLVHFIKKEINIPELRPFRFSKKNKPFLSTLYRLLRDAEKKWPGIPKTFTPISLNDSRAKGPNFDYSPARIRSKIHATTQTGYYCTFMVNTRQINITLMLDNKTNAQKMCEIVSKRVFLWLSIATAYAKTRCTDTMAIFIYMTDEKKELPSKRLTPIEEVNVNTAYTIPCRENIYIYRSEEWFKVFIHETFHNLSLDFATMSSVNSTRHILSIMPLNISDVRVYETYCETWARIMNTMFLAHHAIRDKANVPAILKRMEQYIDIEQRHAMFQSTKMLAHYGLIYTDITMNPSAPKTVPKKLLNYKENTYALSYFILTPILLFYADDFIDWCIAENGNTFDFVKTEANIQKYCNMIVSHYRDPDYLYAIDHVGHLYRELALAKPQSFELRNLRMTSLEIEDK